MRRGRRTHKISRVDPDLPITPMLDMSFQLLAYFVMTFNPIAPEGHLDLALPLVKGGDSVMPPPASLDEELDEITVKVEADDAGDIRRIFLSLSGEASVRELPNREALRDALLERRQAKPGATAKVRLELPEPLKYKLFVYLVDEIIRAGYPNVAPSLLDANK